MYLEFLKKPIAVLLKVNLQSIRNMLSKHSSKMNA